MGGTVRRQLAQIAQRASPFLLLNRTGQMDDDLKHELHQYDQAELLMRMVKARKRARQGSQKRMSEYVPAELRLLILERAGHKCEDCVLHEDGAFSLGLFCDIVNWPRVRSQHKILALKKGFVNMFRKATRLSTKIANIRNAFLRWRNRQQQRLSFQNMFAEWMPQDSLLSRFSSVFWSDLKKGTLESSGRFGVRNPRVSPRFEALEGRAMMAVLGPGDLALVGYDTAGSPQDNFSIVALRELDAGTTFFVNDNELSPAFDNSFTELAEMEAQFTVKTGQTIPAGTVINLPWGASAVSTTTYDWTNTTGAELGNSNDELYFYNAPVITSNVATSFITFGQLGSSVGIVPIGLTLGTNAVDTTGAASRYKTAGATYSGTASVLSAAISNAATNWESIGTGQATSLAPSNWTFTVSGRDIALSNSSIAENAGANALVGTLSAIGADAGSVLTYSLPAGQGDNAAFNISGTSLRANASFDFEATNSYTVRVRSTDQGGLFVEKVFIIVVRNVNEAPYFINLSNFEISENAVANTTVGTLSTFDSDAGNTFTYALVPGTGSEWNDTFNISGNALRTNGNNPAVQNSSQVPIRIRTTDQDGLFFEQRFQITFVPTIALSNTVIDENAGSNATVGSLSTNDPSLGSIFTYTLVSGIGSDDNAAFNISGSTLRATASLDFETIRRPLSVRVRTTGQGGLFFEKVFTIYVSNVNEAPTNIVLSTNSIVEDAGANAAVGTLSTVDPDAGNTFTYTLVSGTGADDNTAFNISGSTLRANASFDFETKSSYTVRVRSTDQGGLTTEKVVAIAVTKVNESPTFGQASYSFTIPENSTSGSQGNHWSRNSSISANGRFVSFESYASNLVVGDTNDTWDIFVKDLETGAITLVSASSSGVQGNSSSLFMKSISADGRYVSFQSLASNLVVGDTNETWDIFVKDLQTGVLTLVSASSSGTLGNSHSLYPSITADGRFVSFSSGANNLAVGDTNGIDVFDIFVKDLQTGAITLVSTSSSGIQGNQRKSESNAPNISADGRYVSFFSSANNLVADDTNGWLDVFVKDLQTGTTKLVSTSSSGIRGNLDSYESSISANGRYVSFYSKANNLIPGDTNGALDVFVKDLQTEALTLVSASSSGDLGNAQSALPNISADGRYVSFQSMARNLVAGDTGGQDIFVKDLQTGAIKLVSSNSSGTLGNDQSAQPSISADGRHVSFDSDASNLVDGDVNGRTDVFLKDLQTGAVTLVSATGLAIGRVNATDLDAVTSLTYSLSGTGSSNFVMNSATGAITVAAGAILNFETTPTFVLTATVSDGSLSTSVPVTITLTNVNEAPTDIALSSNSIAEYAGANATVGTLSTIDPDASNTFTYTLVSGTGADDNASFNISGSTLRANASFDFVVKNSYTVRVRSTDQGGLSTEKAFTLAVTKSQSSLPTVATTINEGVGFSDGNQRSQIVSLKVTFSEMVTLVGVNEFTLKNKDTNTFIHPAQIIYTGGTSTSFVITFGAGPGVKQRNGGPIISLTGNSLEDGNYELTVLDRTKVSGDNIFGDNFATDKFFRLFGDSDGDGDVDGADTIVFRQAARSSNQGLIAAFDVDGNGSLNSIDSSAYGTNFGKRRRVF